jgi:hypothetical protein
VVSQPSKLPPEGFNPIDKPEDRRRLEEFWLPSRPDPDVEPDLYAHWEEMFSEPLRFVQASSQEYAQRGGVNMACQIAAPFETSRNWSGAYIVPQRANRFTRVVGRWQVPRVRAGVGTTAGSSTFQCSVWIGLDGKNGWTRSMPQVGTLQTVQNGVPQAPNLWWQWWLRYGPSRPQNITGVAVDFDDVVLCSLSAMSPTLVRFHVKNKNTGYCRCLRAGAAVRVVS